MSQVISLIKRWAQKGVLVNVTLTTSLLIVLVRSAYVVYHLSPSRCVFLGVMFVVLLTLPYLGKNWCRVPVRTISRIARHRGISVALVGLTSFLLSAALSLFLRTPQPDVHDEFSYLLAGDTFAHGRLTNLPHPMWVHFESFHIIQQPTYASKYPPAQGLALAVGQVITGYPIVGVWLSTAVACALICWMLMAWVPSRYALLGGFMALLHPMVISWSQSFWGGSVAMAGGALMLGAFRRTVVQPRALNSVLMGLGMAILANSRPYEGLVLSLLLMCPLFAWTASKKGPTLQVSLKRIALPVFLVLAPTAGAMAFYNLKVTGNVFQMPYMLHEAVYAVAPPFIWQHLRPEPVYHFKEFQDFYVSYVVPFYTGHSSIGGLVASSLIKILLLTFACNWLMIPAIWLLAKPPILKRDVWMRFTVILCGLFAGALLLEIWVFAHYAAPIACLVFAFALTGLRYLRSRRYGGVRGKLIFRATLALCITTSTIVFFHLSQIDSKGWSYQRARIVSELSQDRDRHLVIVRYGSAHNIHQDWVFNDADIDGARVVWARDMGFEQNKDLVAYFKDRRVWLLETDVEDPKLVPYPTQIGTNPGANAWDIK